MLPRSDSIIRLNLHRAVALRRLDIQAALTQARFKIYLIVDTWSFPNAYALFSVKCHFVDQRYQV